MSKSPQEIEDSEELKKVKRAMNAVMKSEDGQVLGKWLLGASGFFESDLSLSQTGYDGLATAYSVGRRSIGVALLNMLRKDVKKQLLGRSL